MADSQRQEEQEVFSPQHTLPQFYHDPVSSIFFSLKSKEYYSQWV